MPLRIDDVDWENRIRGCYWQSEEMRLSVRVNSRAVVRIGTASGGVGLLMERLRTGEIGEEQFEEGVASIEEHFIRQYALSPIFDRKQPIFLFAFSTRLVAINRVLEKIKGKLEELYRSADYDIIDISPFLSREGGTSATSKDFHCEEKFTVHPSVVSESMRNHSDDYICNLLILDDTISEGKTLNCLLTVLHTNGFLDSRTKVLAEIVYNNAKMCTTDWAPFLSGSII